MSTNNFPWSALEDALLKPRRAAQPGLGAPPASVSPMMTHAPGALNQWGQREYDVYDPPPLPPLPFDRQYRRDVPPPADSTGRLTHDMEGRPLGARYVSGLTEVDGLNVGLRREEIADITRGLLGRSAERAPRRVLGISYGRMRFDEQTREPYEVLIRDDLRPDLAQRVEAHELAHVIDVIAGYIPVDNHREQLRSIYNTLNNPRRRGGDAAPGPLFVPFQRSRNYARAMGDRELMAEAIRAYLVDPNYIKTVAPDLAATIRDAVNSNPRLAPVIQLNNLQLPTYAGLSQPPGQTQTG